MFQTLTIFVIYLVIPSSPTNGNGITKILNSGELVEKELAPIEENLKIIVDSQTSNDKKLDLKGEIRGSVKKIIERAIKADRLLKEQGAQDNQNQIFSKMLRLLGVRSRVETLVDDLYPIRRPYHIGVAKAYEEILTSDELKFRDRSCIKVFRERVSSYGLSAEDFVDGIRSIYGSFSDKAAHKMSAFEPSPPKYYDKEGIEQMFNDFGITPDEIKVKAAQIILQPLPLLNATTDVAF